MSNPTIDHGDEAFGDYCGAPWGQQWTNPHAGIYVREVCGCTMTVSLARDIWYLVVTGDVHFPGIRLPGVRDAKEARERAVAELRGRLGKIVEGLG